MQAHLLVCMQGCHIDIVSLCTTKLLLCMEAPSERSRSSDKLHTKTQVYTHALVSRSTSTSKVPPGNWIIVEPHLAAPSAGALTMSMATTRRLAISPFRASSMPARHCSDSRPPTLRRAHTAQK